MGIDFSSGIAFLRTQIASGSNPPKSGNIFLSIIPTDIEHPMLFKWRKIL